MENNVHTAKSLLKNQICATCSWSQYDETIYLRCTLRGKHMDSKYDSCQYWEKPIWFNHTSQLGISNKGFGSRSLTNSFSK
jgi:hypothetical protein